VAPNVPSALGACIGKLSGASRNRYFFSVTCALPLHDLGWILACCRSLAEHNWTGGAALMASSRPPLVRSDASWWEWEMLSGRREWHQQPSSTRFQSFAPCSPANDLSRCFCAKRENHTTAIADMAPKTNARENTEVEKLWLTSQCMAQ
jgi:hypothetical protein